MTLAINPVMENKHFHLIKHFEAALSLGNTGLKHEMRNKMTQWKVNVTNLMIKNTIREDLKLILCMIFFSFLSFKLYHMCKYATQTGSPWEARPWAASDLWQVPWKTLLVPTELCHDLCFIYCEREWCQKHKIGAKNHINQNWKILQSHV